MERKTITEGKAREPKEAGDFAKRLRKLMKSNGIKTQTELARLVGTTVGEVGHWTKGDRTPTLLRHIKRLCEIFNVSSDYLLFGDVTWPQGQSPEENDYWPIRILG